MTPAAFEAHMAELVKTTNREVLHAKGLRLIADALGANAAAYIPGIDVFLERVKQLGRPVVPTRFQSSHNPSDERTAL